jgi:hypothetical protein
MGKQAINAKVNQKLNPKVDAYIAKAQPFAQPILAHLRKLVHKGCPGVEETIKWSRPFFEYRGAILGNMSGFKQHCSFGFWGEEIGAVLRKAKAVQDGAMGSLGRITRVEDLPATRRCWSGSGRRQDLWTAVSIRARLRRGSAW